MRRAMLVVVTGVCVSWSLADDERGKGKPTVKVLSAVDVAEKIDGKKAKSTTVEVSLGPGEASAPHRHPGPVFGYVIEGEYEWAIDDNKAKVLKGCNRVLAVGSLGWDS